MRVERFKDWLADQLAGQPGVESVDRYEVGQDTGSLTDLKVIGSDGVSLFLRIVRTTPGGENFEQPETIVTKDGVAAQERTVP